MEAATSLHHVHMVRPDPRAPDSTQVWRAWTEMTSPSEGEVVTQEGHIGGRITQVEVGQKLIVPLDPGQWLSQQVAARLESGWRVTMSSSELRIPGSTPERLYSVVAGKGQEYQLATQLVTLLDPVTSASDIDWATPETLHILEKETKPPEWEGSIQIGRDRIVIGVGRRRRNVVVASVPEGSIADMVLAVWASSLGTGATVSATDMQGKAVDLKELVSTLTLPDWLEAIAVKLGLRGHLPRPGGWGAGTELKPIVF